MFSKDTEWVDRRNLLEYLCWANKNLPSELWGRVAEVVLRSARSFTSEDEARKFGDTLAPLFPQIAKQFHRLYDYGQSPAQLAEENV